MLVNQIAVFLENRKGRLAAMLAALSDAGINVESLHIADTRDFGIVRIITDDNPAAKKALTAAGFTVAAALSPPPSACSAKRASISSMSTPIRERAARRSSFSRPTRRNALKSCSADNSEGSPA